MCHLEWCNSFLRSEVFSYCTLGEEGTSVKFTQIHERGRERERVKNKIGSNGRQDTVTVRWLIVFVYVKVFHEASIEKKGGENVREERPGIICAYLVDWLGWISDVNASTT